MKLTVTMSIIAGILTLLWVMGAGAPTGYTQSNVAPSTVAPSNPVQSNVAPGNPAQSTAVTSGLGPKCDGSTDDTASIQHIVDAALKSDHDVHLPSGTCIISPPSPELIVRIGSGLTIEGDGPARSVIKIKDKAGDFTTIFGPNWANVNGITLKNFAIDYNSAQNQPQKFDRPRFVISTARGSNGLILDNVSVLNIESINSIYSASDGTEIRNCHFEINSSATVPHDHSTIYIASEKSLVDGNTFVGAVNGAGSVTAIETHGGGQVVQHNSIAGYFVGMNITGVAPIESKNIQVSDNKIADTYHGIAIWSKKYRSHVSGAGISGIVVARNEIAIAQARWTKDPVTSNHVLGNASGITVDPTSDLPLTGLEISNNSVEYQLNVGPQNVLASSGMGIGYWDTTGANNASTINISDNTILNAPAAAIRWAANSESVQILRNKIVDAGSSTDQSLVRSYRAAIMISPNVAAKDVTVSQNAISSSNYGLSYALEIIGNSCVMADGNTVEVTGAAIAGYLQYAYTSRAGCITISRAVQTSPPLQRSMLPAFGVAEGSVVSDTNGSWRYNGAGWIQAKP